MRASPDEPAYPILGAEELHRAVPTHFVGVLVLDADGDLVAVKVAAIVGDGLDLARTARRAEKIEFVLTECEQGPEKNEDRDDERVTGEFQSPGESYAASFSLRASRFSRLR